MPFKKVDCITEKEQLIKEDEEMKKHIEEFDNKYLERVQDVYATKDGEKVLRLDQYYME